MGGLARRGESMQDRFGRELLERFRAAPAVADSWYSAERFAIGYRRSGGAATCWAYLGNLYSECASLAGEPRDERLARYVAAMAEPACVPSDWARAAPLLRPLLCGVSFGRRAPGGPARWSGPPNEADLVRRVALPMLDELVVVDLPSSVGYVTAALVADWGVPADEVFATARRNLAADHRCTGVPAEPTTLLRFVDDGDVYWVPRLLQDGWLARLAGDRLGGARPVAFAPDRDSLLVAPEGPTLAGIFDVVAAEYAEATHPVSPMGYTLDDSGALVPFTVPADHPLYPAVRRAERLLAGREYDEQAELLRAGQSAVAVASYLLADTPDGTAVSVSTWAEDAPTLLPYTDQVALVSRDRSQSWLVGWDALVSSVPHIPVRGLAPARLRVSRWPTGEQRHHLMSASLHRRYGADG
jgi:hypothetical protein